MFVGSRILLRCIESRTGFRMPSSASRYRVRRSSPLGKLSTAILLGSLYRLPVLAAESGNEMPGSDWRSWDGVPSRFGGFLQYGGQRPMRIHVVPSPGQEIPNKIFS